MSSIIEQISNQYLENKFSEETIRIGDRICLYNEDQYYNLFYYLQQLLPLPNEIIYLILSYSVLESLILEVGDILNISILCL